MGSCQSQSYLTSKYSVADVDEDHIIFCVAQSFFFPLPEKPDSSPVLVRLSQLSAGHGGWFHDFLVLVTLHQVFLNLYSGNKCPCLDSKAIH